MQVITTSYNKSGLVDYIRVNFKFYYFLPAEEWSLILTCEFLHNFFSGDFVCMYAYNMHKTFDGVLDSNNRFFLQFSVSHNCCGLGTYRSSKQMTSSVFQIQNFCRYFLVCSERLDRLAN